MSKVFVFPSQSSFVRVQEVFVVLIARKLNYDDDLQVHKAQDVASKRGKLLTEDFLFLIRKVRLFAEELMFLLSSIGDCVHVVLTVQFELIIILLHILRASIKERS